MMIKKVILFIGVFAFFVETQIMNPDMSIMGNDLHESSVLAMSGEIKNVNEHWLYNDIENWKIEKNNTFFMRKSTKTEIIEMSTGVVRNKPSFRDEIAFSRDGYVVIQNVGRWNGQPVNIRISVSQMVNLTNVGSNYSVAVSFLDSNFLETSLNTGSASNHGSAIITYQYEDTNGVPITLGTYMGIQLTFGSEIAFNLNSVDITALSSWDTTTVPYYYTETANEINFGRKSASGNQPGYLGIEIANTSGFEVKFVGNESMRKYKFFEEIPVFINTPDLSRMDQTFENISAESPVSVNFGQMIPYNALMNLDGYKMEAEIPNDMYYEYDGITIINESGVDKSEFFDVQVIEGKLILTAKSEQLKNPAFYSQYYVFQTNYRLKNNTKVPISQLDENGFYYLSSVGNSSDEKENEVTSLSKISFDSIYVEGITVTPETALIMVSEELQLTEHIFPETATNKSVVWSSSDNKVASVDQNGKVTGLETGEVVITVKTIDGGYVAESKITVRAAYDLNLAVINIKGETANQVFLGDELFYTLTLESVVSPEINLNYKDLSFSIPIDDSLENVMDLQFKTLEGRQVGTVEYDFVNNKVIARLSESDQIHASENLILSYKASVEESAPFFSFIQAKATTKKGNVQEEGQIEAESNNVATLIMMGQLTFVSAPLELKMDTPAKVSTKVQEHSLVTTSEQLSIKDQRGNGSTWSLKAKMSQVLTHSSGRELPDAVHYRDNGIEQQLSLNVEALIYDTTTFSTEEVVVSDRWNNPLEDTGPFVRIQPGEALKGGYSGVIQWSLQDVPGTSVGTNNDE